MATLGSDCNVIINGTGYYIKEDSWHREKPRKITERITKNGFFHYIDKGPLFSTFSFTIYCVNSMENFDGSSNSASANSIRSSLWTLYNNSNTQFTLTTPYNENYTCIFKDLKESILNVGSLSAMEYEMDVVLQQVA